MEANFEQAYKNLNKAQRQAVDAIEGPVMVIAGPGTGKTQVLAVRIANIIQKTGTPADGIVCLTFTNSGVRAMQDRLRTYIGPAASRVVIATFHSFGMKLIEEFYPYLGFEIAPRLIDDLQSVALCDEILHNYDWKHIRTRANPAAFFGDIKSLVSLLKRERVTPEAFRKDIELEIEAVKNDPDNISSRGATKGNLKADALKKIEGLERTGEVVAFYETYEALKRERAMLDYDDVLGNMVRLVEISDEARDTIRERYLYVLVDEHQDSSGVQNEFLAAVWGGLEKPDVFVVGDDRQLIYEFGGASLARFTSFTNTFPDAQMIFLADNYRSTQVILDTAEALLKSSIVDAKLIGHRDGDRKIHLVESDYPRDEIIAAGLEMKRLVEEGMSPQECAILVPKNAQVKSAMRVLADLGLPVASGGAIKLFGLPETEGFLAVLSAIAYPFASEYVAQTVFDPLSGIAPLDAHRFLASGSARKLILEKFLEADDESVSTWAHQMKKWLELSQHTDVYGLIQAIGDELLIHTASDHQTLVRRIEIVRTFLHLALSQSEKQQKLTLAHFLEFVARLREYGTDIPLAVFGADQGVRVMTLHGSKGLEFEYVWIAHVDDRNLGGKRASAFTLPELVKAHMDEKDEETLKRQLYVALTRAKQYCTLSYARHGYTGGDQQLSRVIADMPQDMFERRTLADSESFILENNASAYITSNRVPERGMLLDELATLVADEYRRNDVSVTALNQFFECPWKWYFRSLLRLPEPLSISLHFGSVVHGTIEKILKKKLQPSAADLETLIGECVADLHLSDEHEERRIKKDALGILSTWVERRLPDIAPEYESEYAFYKFRDPEFDHLSITGKIDLLEKLDEVSVRVTDFKTGKPKTKTEIEKEDDEGRMSDYLRQLAMYSFLLEGKSGGSQEAAESRLEFVEAKAGDKNAVYSTKISGDHIERLRQDIRDYDRLLSSKQWVDRPCHHESWKGDGCEYCKLAEIYKKPILSL
jgi:DNA helicase-2/ATP-dependent DNA helicase PcrA